MLIDHTAVVFGLPMWLRVIGRLAFPIYCFLITEGIAHTGSPGRYFLRLGIMAVISEPIYDFVLYSGRSPGRTRMCCGCCFWVRLWWRAWAG